MERLSKKLKTENVPGVDWPMECWYVRAFKIVPNDLVVRVLYSIYLTNRNRADDAIRQLQVVGDGLWDNPGMEYNIGLMYFDLKQYDDSLRHAQRAYELGYPLDGLRKMLEKAGRWK